MSTQTKSRKGIGGPKTDEGKERIRLNALKCGEYANSLAAMQAVSDVVGVSFDEMHQKMLDHYKPADPIEETLIRRIARCSWRLIVIETIENHALQACELRDAPDEVMESLSVMERRTDGQLHRAIAALTAKRRQEQEASMPNAQFSTLNSQFPSPTPSCPSCASLSNDEQENMKNKLPEEPFPSVTYPWTHPEFVRPEPPPTPVTPGPQPDTRDIIGRPTPPARSGTPL